MPPNLHEPMLWQLGDVLVATELGVVIMHSNDFVVLRGTQAGLAVLRQAQATKQQVLDSSLDKFLPCNAGPKALRFRGHPILT